MPASTIDFTIGAARVFPISLGDVSDSTTGRMVFQVVGGGTYSLTPKARLRGASIPDGSLQSVPYVNRSTRSVVAAGTAITTAGLYEADASAAEIVLDGSYTTGACAVYPHPLIGDAIDWLSSSAAALGATTTGVQPTLTGNSNDSSAVLEADRSSAMNTDAHTANVGVKIVGAYAYGFNGTTWDRLRTHASVILLASAARTTTQTSADITLYNEQSIDVILDMTVVGTGSVTVTINGKDPASGKYYALLAGAAVITNVTNVYRVGRGLLAAANAVANFSLPRTIQIVVTANNANSAVYSVGYNLSV
jgi:hypothetical protein